MSDETKETPPPDPAAEAAAASPAARRLQEARAGGIAGWHLFAGEVTAEVETQGLEELAYFLRDDEVCRFEMLSDISGADFPDREKRFQVAYHLVSVRHNQRLRVRVAVAEGEALPSLMPVWPGADWFEREVYDMFGVHFSGHPHLVRILMPDDWVGYPLRKDYPLPGYPEQHLRYRTADVTRRSYVDISWRASAEKAAAIVKKYKGRGPDAEASPHVPVRATPPAADGGS